MNQSIRQIWSTWDNVVEYQLFYFGWLIAAKEKFELVLMTKEGNLATTNIQSNSG